MRARRFAYSVSASELNRENHIQIGGINSADDFADATKEGDFAGTSEG
jgi:hypothetical protein